MNTAMIRRVRAYVCGFCSSGDCSRCPGAVTRGPGKGVVTCACPGHGQQQPRCLACGNRNPDEVTTGWRCLEPLICQGRIVERSLQNPLHAELMAAKQLGGEARRRALAERTVIQVLRDVETAGVDRAPAATGQCQCEGAHQKCRETPQPTKARFAVGHDQALKMALRKRARQTLDLPLAEDAKRRMIELGWEKYL